MHPAFKIPQLQHSTQHDQEQAKSSTHPFPASSRARNHGYSRPSSCAQDLYSVDAAGPPPVAEDAAAQRSAPRTVSPVLRPRFFLRDSSSSRMSLGERGHDVGPSRPCASETSSQRRASGLADQVVGIVVNATERKWRFMRATIRRWTTERQQLCN